MKENIGYDPLSSESEVDASLSSDFTENLLEIRQGHATKRLESFIDGHPVGWGGAWNVRQFNFIARILINSSPLLFASFETHLHEPAIFQVVGTTHRPEWNDIIVPPSALAFPFYVGVGFGGNNWMNAGSLGFQMARNLILGVLKGDEYNKDGVLKVTDFEKSMNRYWAYSSVRNLEVCPNRDSPSCPRIRIVHAID